jgi:hypothetical protein
VVSNESYRWIVGDGDELYASIRLRAAADGH